MTFYTCTTDINVTLLYSHRSLNAYIYPHPPDSAMPRAREQERAQHQHRAFAGMGISIVIDNE
jgi:hypothetical protein